MDAVNWHTFFFLFFALVTCGAAVAVVVSSNVVHMAVYLILSLSAASGLFFLAGAEFVGAMQLMIYVGGTLVLLVFGVMLTAQSAFSQLSARGPEWIVGGSVGLLLLVSVLLPAVLSVPEWSPAAGEQAVTNESRSTEIGTALLGIRAEEQDEGTNTSSTANDSTLGRKTGAGLAGYVLPFELVSVYLLVVLIGAAYLARPKRRRTISIPEAEGGGSIHV